MRYNSLTLLAGNRDLEDRHIFTTTDLQLILKVLLMIRRA
jgi:hypothetical protein